MTTSEFAARARRALRKPPGYLAARGIDAIRRRLQRPLSSALPRLVTERMLLRQAGEPDIDALWDSLAARPFFVGPGRRASWAAAFQREYPASRDRIVADADRAVRHVFDLLGSGPVDLGADIPWLTDFKTGRTWPPQYCRDIQYEELDRPTDVKVPWELSRCQHFTRLGQAYWLTGDDRYAREFVDETGSWIDANPYAWSVNWACAMDVALRAVSWIWGFYFMADAPACRSRDFRALFLRALFLHGEFVATHLENADVNGNHYLCDGVGLVFLGCLFGTTPRGRKWRRVGQELVVSEIFTQVTTDGVDFEQSTAYHRLVLEAFATSYLLLKAHGLEIPAGAWTRLERMCEYVEAYTKPDGLAPLVGDADDGRVQILGTARTGDHRYLLSNAALIFDRAAFKERAGCFWDESFWTFGPEGLDRFRAMPAAAEAPRSAAFPDGGFFVLRSESAHLFIDCGDVGMRGRGGHGHNDILSVELFLNGFNVVTDCGAYLYTASREWRNRFRSTAFHNGVQVDGEELNRFIGPDFLWQLRNDAHPVQARLFTGPRADAFRGAHDGYSRLDPPVTHARECLVDRQAPRVLIRDSLTGRGEHELTWRFHLDPAVTPERRGSDVRLTAGGRDVWLLPDERAAFMTFEIEDGWVSPSYGVRVPTRVLVWRGRAGMPLTIAYLFAESCLSTGERARAAALLASAAEAPAG
jgi:Heparinase II/III-like protein/Heparinase II/III N-terminus